MEECGRLSRVPLVPVIAVRLGSVPATQRLAMLIRQIRKSLWPGAVLFAVIFAVTVAPNVHADSFTDPNGTIIFPDGSVITSNTFVPSTAANGFSGYTDIAFQFTGGTGFASNLIALGAGESGRLVFTESVSNLSVDLQYSYGLYANFFSFDFGELGSFTQPVCTTYPVRLCSAVVTFANPGTFEMTWDTNQAGQSVSGIGGVNSHRLPSPRRGRVVNIGDGAKAPASRPPHHNLTFCLTRLQLRVNFHLSEIANLQLG